MKMPENLLLILRFCFVYMMQKRRLYPKKSLSSEPSKCDASVKRLRSAILVKEEEVLELREEATYLSRLAARTIRKGLHCLSLQLTIQYYNHLRKETHSTNRTILEDDRLYHYIIYSENVLAAAAAVNPLRLLQVQTIRQAMFLRSSASTAMRRVILGCG